MPPHLSSTYRELTLISLPVQGLRRAEGRKQDLPLSADTHSCPWFPHFPKPTAKWHCQCSNGCLTWLGSPSDSTLDTRWPIPEAHYPTIQTLKWQHCLQKCSLNLLWRVYPQSVWKYFKEEATSPPSALPLGHRLAAHIPARIPTCGILIWNRQWDFCQSDPLSLNNTSHTVRS